MDQVTMGALVQGGSSLLSLPFNIYGDYQNLKMDRKRLAEEKKSNRFTRLMNLVQASNGAMDRSSAIGRMNAIRNAGRG